MNRAFLERCNEIEATFEMSREKSAPASTAAEGETSETTAARDRAAEIERDRQQGVVYYEAYRTLGRLQTFVWINTKELTLTLTRTRTRTRTLTLTLALTLTLTLALTLTLTTPRASRRS